MEVLMAVRTPEHGLERNNAMWMHGEDELCLLRLVQALRDVGGAEVGLHLQQLVPQLTQSPESMPVISRVKDSMRPT